MHCQDNPPSLPSEVFADLNFLPYRRVLDSDNRCFEDTYETNPTVKYLPLLKDCGNITADKDSKHLLTATTVCTT